MAARILLTEDDEDVRELVEGALVEVERIVVHCAGRSISESNVPDEPASSSIEQLVARLAAAYVRRSKIDPDQVSTLISTIHQTLANLGKEAPAEGPRKPAVPVRQSVKRDYVVCLECGFRGQMIRGHISRAHGLSVDEYRARWSLRTDHPVIAPAYSERRSSMAKEAGFGEMLRKARSPASVKARRSKSS